MYNNEKRRLHMFFKRKRQEQTLKIPHHVAFIMDGNGRWAKKRGLPRSLGHREGCKRIKEVALLCLEYKIGVMSIFCFSTENWKRPQAEVDYLFKLLEEFFKKEIDEMNQKGIRVMTSGDITKLPVSTQTAIAVATDLTKTNKNLILNICLNYGGRDEIVTATKAIARSVLNYEITVDQIDENYFKSRMMCYELPDIDVMVRTSGEYRISNYMLYELAYAELIFLDQHWPSFNRKLFVEMLEIYSSRDRRFGGIKDGR